MFLQLSKLVLTTALLASPVVAFAQSHSTVPIGKTGEVLHNNANRQQKHYIEQDSALLTRIWTLMADMDLLLCRLHALPPELSNSVVVLSPVHDELIGLINVALENNPGLDPYRTEMAILAAKTKQAGAENDPMLSFKMMNLPSPQFTPDDTPMTQFSLGVSQKFFSYGKRKLKRRIAGMEEELKEYSLAQRELDLVGEITDLYFSLCATQAKLQVLEANIELLTLLIEFGESKYALGMVPQAQVLNAQVSLTGLEERRIKLASLWDKQQVVLLGYLGNPAGFSLEGYSFSASYPLPTSVEFDVSILLQDSLDYRPDYNRLSAMERQHELMVELAHRGFRPDYTISASYGVRWGKRDFVSAGVMIPLFTNKQEKQDAKLQEQYAMLALVADRKLVVENMLLTRLSAIQVEIDQLAATSELYRTALIPQSRLALDSSIASFAANRLDFSDLIKSQQSLLNHELELEQQYISYLNALAELQVVSAGAFDPMPYLVPDLGFSSEVADAGLLNVPAVPRIVNPLVVPLPTGSFINSLDLPETSLEEATFRVVQPDDGSRAIETTPVKDVDSAADDEESAGDDPVDDDSKKDNFYKPFNPRKEGGDG